MVKKFTHVDYVTPTNKNSKNTARTGKAKGHITSTESILQTTIK